MAVEPLPTGHDLIQRLAASTRAFPHDSGLNDLRMSPFGSFDDVVAGATDGLGGAKPLKTWNAFVDARHAGIQTADIVGRKRRNAKSAQIGKARAPPISVYGVCWSYADHRS